MSVGPDVYRRDLRNNSIRVFLSVVPAGPNVYRTRAQIDYLAPVGAKCCVVRRQISLLWSEAFLFGNVSINISTLCGKKTAVIRISFIGISDWTTKYHAKT
jgi:hypothetical protein